MYTLSPKQYNFIPDCIQVQEEQIGKSAFEKFEQIISPLLLGQYYLTIHKAGLLVNKTVFCSGPIIVEYPTTESFIFKWTLKVFASPLPIFLLLHFCLFKRIKLNKQRHPPKKKLL